MTAKRQASIIVSLMLLLGAAVSAQQAKLAFPRPSARVTVSANVPFAGLGTSTLAMDVYQLPRTAGRLRPALIFFNRASGADRRSALYDGWGRAAASRELVGIVPDLRDGSQAQDFHALLQYLTTHGAAIGVDVSAIAVYAASGNVYTAFPILEDPEQRTVKAAIIYYGTAPIASFRRDLPILYVRAGLDRPDVNEEITKLASVAIAQNAPVTLLNHPTGYHGFELFNDDDATRSVIEQTLAFVKQATTPSYRLAMAARAREAAAAGSVQTGNFREASRIYSELARSRPEDARLSLSYGEALLGDGQFARACSVFGTLRNKGLGPRDLGVPAARACAQAGDADAAIAWLKSIPSRFLPSTLVTDPAFTSFNERPEFRALFAPAPPT